MRPLRIAIIGFGKIAGDQHVPAILGNPRLELAASVSRSGSGPSPHFSDHHDLLGSGIAIDAVAVTTPPAARYAIARDCIAAGLHVLLEKPPAATLSEISDLACRSDARPVTLFASWHARHNAAVEEAGRRLAGKAIRTMEIHWHEDVRKWHPGQRWIWRAGGFGVFDPGINALSIAVRIFPGSLFVQSADLHFPTGADTPIAADLKLSSPSCEQGISCSFDWRREAGEQWTIRVVTAEGEEILLSDGGTRLTVRGEQIETAKANEYQSLYGHFVDLIDKGQSDVDLRPLRLVADALLVARRFEAGPIPA